MRQIIASLVVSGLFLAGAQAQDTTNAPAPAAGPSGATNAPSIGTLSQPSLSLTPPPDHATNAPAPTSPVMETTNLGVPAAPAPAPSPAPAPAAASAPAPPPTEIQPAPTPSPVTPPVASSTPPPPPQPLHADHFHPEAIIDRCMDGATLSQGRFNRLFSGDVVEFAGTVADINHDENLVVFRGGGVFPDNWDVQLKPHGQKFSIGRTYRVIFRLTHLRDEPLAGYSFRGVVLRRTSDD